jgi:hypothetical protein
MMSMRNYSELSRFSTIDDRFDYLVLGGEVGHDTFGYDRWLNQSFYRSREWRSVRNLVIVRDNGNDMGLDDFPIRGAPHIHHMNPITFEEIELGSDNLMNPDFLICVSQRTHNAIHYGDRSHLPQDLITREPGDTRLW